MSAAHVSAIIGLNTRSTAVLAQNLLDVLSSCLCLPPEQLTATWSNTWRNLPGHNSYIYYYAKLSFLTFYMERHIPLFCATIHYIFKHH